MARELREIYRIEAKLASNIMSTEDIAVNAMFVLKKELEKEFNEKLKKLKKSASKN